MSDMTDKEREHGIITELGDPDDKAFVYMGLSGPVPCSEMSRRELVAVLVDTLRRLEVERKQAHADREFLLGFG